MYKMAFRMLEHFFNPENTKAKKHSIRNKSNLPELYNHTITQLCAQPVSFRRNSGNLSEFIDQCSGHLSSGHAVFSQEVGASTPYETRNKHVLGPLAGVQVTTQRTLKSTSTVSRTMKLRPIVIDI